MQHERPIVPQRTGGLAVVPVAGNTVVLVAVSSIVLVGAVVNTSNQSDN